MSTLPRIVPLIIVLPVVLWQIGMIALALYHGLLNALESRRRR